MFTNNELAHICNATAVKVEESFKNHEHAAKNFRHELSDTYLSVARKYKRIEIVALMAQTGVHSEEEIDAIVDIELDDDSWNNWAPIGALKSRS